MLQVLYTPQTTLVEKRCIGVLIVKGDNRVFIEFIDQLIVGAKLRTSKLIIFYIGRFDAGQCEICKGPLQDPVQVPCQHAFCMSCANGWFENQNECPICKEEVGDNFEVKVNQRYRCMHF